MGNATHLRILEHGAAHWNSWRQNNPNENPDLESLRLSGTDLRGADFHATNMRFSKLDGVDFEGANLAEASLINARLRASNLKNAILRGVHANGAILKKCCLRRANFQDAVLLGANLCEADCEEANFTGADMRKAWFAKALLVRANLETANLTNANLTGASLHGAILLKANFQEAILEGADLQETFLQEANLAMAVLVGAMLTGADMRKTNLSGIRVSPDILHLIPQELLKDYGNTFIILGVAPSIPGNNFTTRYIEFPPEYHQAGLSILNYFGTVLRQKYPEKRIKVRIEQDGLKVTMIVETAQGDRESIERALDAFGMVVLNEMPASRLLANPLQAMALEHKLEMAKMEVRQAYALMNLSNSEHEKRIASLEQDNRWLRQHVGRLLTHSGDLIGVAKEVLGRDEAFLRDMALQSEAIQTELSTLADMLGILDTVREDIEEVKEILLSIRQKEPGKYERIKGYFSELATGTTASIYATVIWEALKLIT